MARSIQTLLRCVALFFLFAGAHGAGIAFAAATACTNDQATACALETGRATNDPQFTPGNIANGVTILGVTGSHIPYAGYPPSYPYTGPAGCSSIGDLCADGTVYIGHHPTLLVPLYIPVTDQGSGLWKTSQGTDDIAIDSSDDGRLNTNQVPNNTVFPAFKFCKDLTTGGHSDWYLPSAVELFYLGSVRAAIAAKGITTLTASYYWSSSETDFEAKKEEDDEYNYNNLAFLLDTFYINIFDIEKDKNYGVRCMRR